LRAHADLVVHDAAGKFVQRISPTGAGKGASLTVARLTDETSELWDAPIVNFTLRWGK